MFDPTVRRASEGIDAGLRRHCSCPSSQSYSSSSAARPSPDCIRFLGDLTPRPWPGGDEEGIGDAISAKIHNVLSFFEGHADHGCVDLRLHKTTLYTSIYRFDRDMLVNHHVLGLPAAHAPVMHLRQLDSGDLFATYADTFERVWSTAVPAWQQREVA
jgi:hypothetical protein